MSTQTYAQIMESYKKIKLKPTMRNKVEGTEKIAKCQGKHFQNEDDEQLTH
jgi:hypothetical protein